MKPSVLVSALFAFPLALSAQPAAPQAKTYPAPRVPAGVVAHRDLAYVADGHERQKLDLYVPEKSGGPWPVIVWVHGGAWQSGSKEQCRPLQTGFVERGYAIVSVNYRLSGHAIFPAQLEDCKAAIRWARAHARDYNLDSAHFGAWGGSAGGHLVAMLGTTGDVKEFDVGAHLDFSSRVQAVTDWFGPTDFLQMDRHATPSAKQKHDAPNSPESKLIGGAITDPANRAKVQRANPITTITDDDPPFLIVHATGDPTVPYHQSVLLYDGLVAARRPVRLHTIEGGGHGSGGFTTPPVIEMVATFFDRHLKGAASDAAQWPTAMKTSMKATSAKQ